MAATAARADRGAGDRKTELLHILARTAIADRSAPVSLRQFAIRAGVSEPTLRHYFSDRRGVVIAIIALFAEGARDWLARCAQPQASLEAAVSGYGDMALEGANSDQFAQAHAFALVESIHDPLVARSYLDTIIEPSLKAIEARLAPSLDPDGTRCDQVRHAAMALYAPVLIAVLHQRLLKGDEARPLDMGDFFADLAKLFAHGLKQPD